MLLPWLALRHRWALHRHSIARRGPAPRYRQDTCRELSGARGAGQYLGLFRRRFDPRARDPAGPRYRRARLRHGRDGALSRPGRPCRRWADGPGALALRASILVVALAPFDPRESEGARAITLRVLDD